MFTKTCAICSKKFKTTCKKKLFCSWECRQEGNRRYARKRIKEKNKIKISNKTKPMIITKIFKFDSAHYLPNYKGKCANMHGHTYTLEVSFEGDINKETGMVMDFSLIAEICEKIIAKLDHKVINEIIALPTAENIVEWIEFELASEISLKKYPRIKKIKLWETPDSYAEKIY